MKTRLDVELSKRGLALTRSQAESIIRLGQVELNGKIASKPGAIVKETDKIRLISKEQYVSRAGLKLASVAKRLKLNFSNKTVLDVGSSTGGFTDYALRHGAKKVIAVDVGTNQLHPSLQGHRQIELHEKTDIRNFKTSEKPDIILIDVSFISLREVLPSIAKIADHHTMVVAMAKPQFESGSELKNKGVIKNEKIRRDLLNDLETWIKKLFIIGDKADSEVAGSKGNRERFYLLRLAQRSH